MKIKIREARGLVLDWLVAVAEGLKPRFFTEHDAYKADVLTQTLKHGDYILVLRPNNRMTSLSRYAGYNDGVCWVGTFSPSLDWAQGGRISERENIFPMYAGGLGHEVPYHASRIVNYNYQHTVSGDTPLMAIMRCYALSKLGEEFDVPDEICNYLQDIT